VGAAMTARTFAPRDFGQNGRPIGSRDRRVAWGDSTSSRQPAELSAFFEPALVVPVRGDWLVVETVRGIRSLTPEFPANRENYRVLIDYRRFRRQSAVDLRAISKAYAKQPQNGNREF
jgi:hypothetical protein